jgi:hypothetical protein
MNFEQAFREWANRSLTEKIPAEVKAFSFNLYETGVDFGVELIGASHFDVSDSDWACDEVFEPSQRRLEIPLAFSGEKWEQCLDNMRKLVSSYLNSNEPGAKVLNQAQGVGIGFVDGELHLLKRP